MLVHDGFGVWLAVRRLNRGRFIWGDFGTGRLAISRAQLDALVLGLPWRALADGGVITVL